MKRRTRRCFPRVKHDTQETAMRVRDILDREQGTHRVVYHCKYCRAWHLGNPTTHAKQ